MKVLFFAITFVFLSGQIQAQELTVASTLDVKDVDTAPSFYAGEDALYEFISQNFKKPDVPELIGKVLLSFVVETDGTLNEISIVRDIGFGTGAEAERVMKLSPSWIPGRNKGKVVRVKHYLAIPIHTN